MDTALVKSNFSRSGPSIEIRSKVSKDDTVRRFLNVVLTLFIQLNPLSESALLTGRASAIWANLKGEDREY